MAKLSKEAMSTCTMVTRRALTLRATRPMRMISMAMVPWPVATTGSLKGWIKV